MRRINRMDSKLEQPNESEKETTPLKETPKAKEKTKAEWLVMIYLAGDNNLAEECVFALTEMKRIGSVDNKMEVMIHLDTTVHENAVMRVKKGIKPGDTNKELMEMRDERIERMRRRAANPEDEANTDEDDEQSGVVFNFVKKCIDKVEANHHMLILSGHGNGTADSFLREEDEDADGLSVIGMAQQIERINKQLLNPPNFKVLEKKIDVLGLDSCLMSMGEIAYMVHNHVKV